MLTGINAGTFLGSKRGLAISGGLIVALLFIAAGSKVRGGEGSDSTPLSDPGKLVYLDEGDIWTKELPDGEPLRLTVDGRNFAPKWSPSGEWILFEKPVARSRPEVWLMRADGSDARSLDAQPWWPPSVQAPWSPVTDQFAYLNTDGDLVLERADGTYRSILVARDRTSMAERFATPIWSPDGASIAYERQARPFYEGLWRYDLASGDAIELYRYSPPEGQIVPAAWTSDGSRIYFWRSPIYSASIMADGLPLLAVSTGGGAPVELGMTTLLYGDSLSISPDGRLLVVEGGGRDSTARKGVALLDQSGLSRLTADGAAALSPEWAPDGSMIAYVEQPASETLDLSSVSQRRIWIMNADGSSKRRLTGSDAQEERPQWSRDGRYVLYAQPQLLGVSEARASLWLYDLAQGRDVSILLDLALYLNDLERNILYYGHFAWDRLFDWWQPH